MTDSYIQAPPDSTGKLIDTAQLTVGSNSVQRERVIIGDNSTAANYLGINAYGAASTTTYDRYNNSIDGTLVNQMRVAESHRLAGGIFNDGILDTNYYTSSVANGGTVTVANGEAIVYVSTTSGSSAKLTTPGLGRYIGSNPNYFRANIRIPSGTRTNNTTTFGLNNDISSITDGFWFEYSSGVFKIVSMYNSTPTSVSSGSFNGDGTGSTGTYVLDANYHTFEIHYIGRTVQYVIDGVRIHTLTATTTPLVTTRNLKPFLYSVNTGVGTACYAYTMNLTINRYGSIRTQPKYTHIAGITAGTVLKVGPGTLHSVTLNTMVNNSAVSLYDSATTTANPIALIITATGTTPVCLPYEVDFINGLYAVTAIAATDITVSYE